MKALGIENGVQLAQRPSTCRPGCICAALPACAHKQQLQQTPRPYAARCHTSAQSEATTTPPQDAELQLVQVIFRHGARTPLTKAVPYWDGASWLDGGQDCGSLLKPVGISLRDADCAPAPCSQHNSEQVRTILPGGCHKGELTLKGQQMALDLGQQLRRTYVEQHGFLSPDYQTGAIGARTTFFARTTGTLQGVLTGLYPHAPEVAVVTAGDGQEIMYGNVTACPRLGTVLDVRMASLAEHLKDDSAVEVLQRKVRAAMPHLPDDHSIAFVELHDALTSLRTHGKAIPAGLTPELLHAIDVEATRRMAWATAPHAHEPDAQAVLQLSLGHLIAEVADQMTAAAAGQPGPKIRLFSGHDTTVLPFLRILQQDIATWPPYVANVTFQLWRERNSSQHLVRALYNGEPLPLGPDGQLALELQLFLERYLAPYRLDMSEHDAACAIDIDTSQCFRPSPQGTAASGSAVQGI